MTSRIGAIVEAIQSQVEAMKSHFPQAEQLVDEGEFGGAEESLNCLKVCIASLETAIESERLLTLPALELADLQKFATNVANVLPQVIQDVGGQHGNFSNHVDGLHRKLWTARLIDANAQEESYSAALGKLGDSMTQARAHLEEIEEALELRDKASEAAEEADAMKTAAGSSAAEAASSSTRVKVLEEATEITHETFSRLSAEIGAFRENAEAKQTEVSSLEADLRKWHGDIAETRTSIETLKESTEASLEEHDADIRQRQSDLEEIKGRIEDKFRLVSSGALAKAFGARQKELFWTKNILGVVALAGYVGFVGVAAWQVVVILKSGATDFDWGPLVVRVVAAIPMGLLIWFVTVQYGKARRTHEAYAFKETVASSFDAYRDLVEKITKDETLKGNVPYSEFIRATISGLYTEPPMGKEEDDHPPHAKAVKELTQFVTEFGKMAQRVKGL